MNINQLRYFISVATNQNFSRAAEEHYITQSAISRQIMELERFFQTKLFERSTHGVSLTREGEEVLEYAKEVVDKTQEVQSRVQNIKNGNTGFVKISTFTNTVFQLLDCLADFSEDNKNIHLQIDLLTGSEQIAAIANHKYDFYFAELSMVEKIDYLEYIKINHDTFCLLVPKSIEDKIRIDDFSCLDNMAFSCLNKHIGPPMYNQVMEVCRSNNYVPNITNYYNRADAALFSVQAGHAVSILPRSLAELYNFDQVAILPLGIEEPYMCSVLAWEKNAPFNAAAEKFKETAVGIFG